MARVGNGSKNKSRAARVLPGGDEEHRPGAERLSNDELLRGHGFRIHRRPRTGPTIWRHPDGGICTEAEALHYMLRDLKLQGKE